MNKITKMKYLLVVLITTIISLKTWAVPIAQNKDSIEADDKPEDYSWVFFSRDDNNEKFTRFSYNSQYPTKRLEVLDLFFRRADVAKASVNPEKIMMISMIYNTKNTLRPWNAERHSDETHKFSGYIDRTDEIEKIEKIMNYLPIENKKYITDFDHPKFTTQGFLWNIDNIKQNIKSWTQDKDIVILLVSTHGATSGHISIPTYTKECRQSFQDCCRQLHPVIDSQDPTIKNGDLRNIYIPRGLESSVAKYYDKQGSHEEIVTTNYKMDPQSEHDWDHKKNKYRINWKNNNCKIGGYMNIDDFLEILKEKQLIIVKSTCYAGTWISAVNKDNPNLQMLVTSSQKDRYGWAGVLMKELDKRMKAPMSCSLDESGTIQDFVLTWKEWTEGVDGANSASYLSHIGEKLQTKFGVTIAPKYKDQSEAIPRVANIPVTSISPFECKEGRYDAYAKFVEQEKREILELEKARKELDQALASSTVSDNDSDNYGRKIPNDEIPAYNNDDADTSSYQSTAPSEQITHEKESLVSTVGNKIGGFLSNLFGGLFGKNSIISTIITGLVSAVLDIFN